MTPSRDRLEPESRRIAYKALRFLGVVMFLGLFVIALHAFGHEAPTLQEACQRLGAGLLTALCSAGVGALLGFLFGIPRTLQSSELPEDGSKRYQDNTNLEQISDWLTKILVGVGLTQLTKIPRELDKLTGQLAPALGGGEPAMVLAGALVVGYTTSGFLFGYLWTRIYLPQALRAWNNRFEDLERKVGAWEKQKEADATAITLVERHLDPRDDSPKVDRSEMQQAIQDASPAVKTTLYYVAWRRRKDSWKEAADATRALVESPTEEDRKNRTRALQVVANTIQVFEALIKADTKGQYHANFGQLGFALKDKEPPEYEKAAENLTRAIQIRDRQGKKGWYYYELNRAICRIAALRHQPEEVRLSASLRNEIVSDLRLAAQEDNLLRRIILGEEDLVLTGEEPSSRGSLPAISRAEKSLVVIWAEQAGVDLEKEIGVAPSSSDRTDSSS